jgi:predicted regulator of Ras-like GTPase activity (Roadblock/LC7/MglB family)
MNPDLLRAWKEELARDAHSLAFLPMVDALRRNRQFDEAHRYALRGLEIHPHLAGAHDALARVLADLGRDAAASDEWQFALRLDPAHQASLRGLGFLAYKRRDLAGAESYLARAVRLDPADAGIVAALRRLRVELRGSPDAPLGASGANGHGPDAPAAGSAPDTGDQSRELFAALLGDGDRTALLLDRDGLVLAGTYLDGEGRDVADEIGAHLGGLAEESTRALQQLGLGHWDALVVEAQHATVALAPGLEGSVVMIAAARDTQVGLVRRLLRQAQQRAAAWMGATA